jgi:hypothetical protein
MQKVLADIRAAVFTAALFLWISSCGLLTLGQAQSIARLYSFSIFPLLSILTSFS